MPWLGIGLKLLGFGKGILSGIAGFLKGLTEWCGKHPTLALAIAIDIVLLYGCWWGYRQHNKVVTQASQIQVLKADNTSLGTRLQQYVKALADAQKQLVDTIQDNNKAVDNLKKTADAQLARAEAEAAKTRKQRDEYAALVGKYHNANPSTGTAEQRIVREESTNRQFITDFQKVKK